MRHVMFVPTYHVAGGGNLLVCIGYPLLRKSVRKGLKCTPLRPSTVESHLFRSFSALPLVQMRTLEIEKSRNVTGNKVYLSVIFRKRQRLF